MPEIRYDRVETWADGELVNVQEIPYEVSDEELYQEELKEKFNLGHDDLIALITEWDDMSDKEKGVASNQFVPYFAEWMLWKDGWLKLGVL